MTASLHAFVSERLEPEVARFVERVRHAPDVARVAVMPDVHLAGAACVGTVIATRRTIYPALLGSDLGCGVAALPLGVSRAALDDPKRARAALHALQRAVPVLRGAPASFAPPPSPGLERTFEKEGRFELGTIGRGNHFLELRSDAQDELHLVVHTGSRAMGHAIQGHRARHPSLDAESEDGRRYLDEVAWALAFACENRRLVLERASDALGELFTITPDTARVIECQHDSVLHEVHEGEALWVHRKGAIALPGGALALVPGSMGAATHIVRGRGDLRAMSSCAHGAGRAIPRGIAHRTIDVRRLASELDGIVLDESKLRALVDEAPSAYKELRAVMRAQRELVAIVGTLDPFVVHKGG